MNILVDIGHPAHVHLFRNAMRIWHDHGHSIAITIRDKDITAKLLDLYGLSYTIASSARQGTLGLGLELFEHDWGVLKIARQHKSQILMGTSIAAAHVARLIGAKSIIFNEDDASVAKTFVRLAYPLAHAIVTPTCLNEDHGERHITYNGYQKLAYLHPNYFTPNPEVLSRLGVALGEPFFILRFVSLKAAHDRGEAGMSLLLREKIIHKLSEYGRVFITSESSLEDGFKPYQIRIDPTDIHDALFYATMFIGDSQSMAVEAAILGIPTIRINTFANRCSVLQELEMNYQLGAAFLPTEEDEIFSKISEWLNYKDLKAQWEHKRSRLLSEKIDVTEWMVEMLEQFVMREF